MSPEDVSEPLPLVQPSSSSSSSAPSGGSSASSLAYSGVASRSDSDIVVQEEDAEADKWRREIDGVARSFEVRPEYSRLVLRCMHHFGCYKKRNVHEAQQAKLGAREPVAFF